MRSGVPDTVTSESPLKVAIAGGGVGGLFLARALQKRGIECVSVYEKTDEFKRFGGPIQLASNALSTIKAIDNQLFEKIMEKFTFTGMRTCGIKDGMRSTWYSKFDAIAGAADMANLPYTGVINRPDLQEVMLKEIGEGVMNNGKPVVSYEHLLSGGVEVTLESGEKVEVDALIGADGIWSAVRAQMWGEKARDLDAVTYSGYTVFAGETTFETPDYWDVGYKVYIGPNKYFVTSDVGCGRMQWYAFLALPPGTKSRESNLNYIKNHFEGWSPEIHLVLDVTAENDIEQRDLYDRPPSMLKRWNQGSVAILGDAAHPMMPNLGQGGCQALEDAYKIAEVLSKCKTRQQIPAALESYHNQRFVRASIVQGLSRLSSDLIIQRFATPTAVKSLLPLQLEYPSVNGVFTALLRPFLNLIFWAQFSYLYSVAPVKMGDEDRRELLATERARAKVNAEAAW
eukprot:CAMPEP_0113940988 /NCGR_PEP_ID=MMETSP1339-20121228/6996_1 /TAXON_ID=94617 /ORGANISM="Fibrocapsa japonica" /LENGTH=455 /DNA_ID=CAMNT_0000945001 /DNA_START=226 /DNA_END=1590 /DNA_ORIENTATION=- /assembly_acc=CAM_ASM_000762